MIYRSIIILSIVWCIVIQSCPANELHSSEDLTLPAVIGSRDTSASIIRSDSLTGFNTVMVTTQLAKPDMPDTPGSSQSFAYTKGMFQNQPAPTSFIARIASIERSASCVIRLQAIVTIQFNSIYFEEIV
ncbi:MAG: hypothetical protein ACHQQQ_11345 [Bacteroidota bacterium]